MHRSTEDTSKGVVGIMQLVDSDATSTPKVDFTYYNWLRRQALEDFLYRYLWGRGWK